MSSETGVFISGAGPTGLLLALWLTRFNVPYRLVDPAPTTGTTSRAIVVHARVLEFYDQLGIAQQAIDHGVPLQGLKVSYDGQLKAQIPFHNAGKGKSKFPFVLSLAQDDHEALLESELRRVGGKVERGKETIGIDVEGDGCIVTVKDIATGVEEKIKAKYVAGCDGAHSAVRRLMGIKMEGGTYTRRFFVADIQATGRAIDSAAVLHGCLSAEDFIVMIRMKGEQSSRVVGFVPEGFEENPDQVTFDDCLATCKRNLGDDLIVHKVNWFSTYKVHHRHASQFRYNRVFLLGDAAHLHSPVGGQGMNTGLGDSTNFAWKVAAAFHNPDMNLDDLLTTYDTERKAFASQLVATTDTAFTRITASGWSGRTVRSVFVPFVMPWITWAFDLAPTMWNTISQLAIEYGKSPLSVNLGVRGSIKAGQRLPWVPNVTSNGQEYESNFKFLKASCWQGHVFGDAQWAMSTLSARAVSLHIMEWSNEAKKKGIGQDVLYLVRPDGHVGLVLGKKGDVEFLEIYMNKWGVV